MKKIILLFVVLLLISTSLIAQVYPGKTWTINEKPVEDGWNAYKMNVFRQFLNDSTNLTGLVIVHKGQIVFYNGNIEENSYIASCRKSVMAMLYGKYVKNGQIDLNKTLCELKIEDVSKLSCLEKQATVKDLISARSGVFLIGSNPGDSRRYAPDRNTKKPGEYWLYSNWDFNLAGYIFEKETGKSIYDEVEKQLAIPLKMQDWDRCLQKKYGDANISLFPAYHMWFSTRDMARIGLLMMNKGKWNEKQLIAEDWVNEMTSQITSSQEVSQNDPNLVDFGYGYMWWLWENTSDKRFKNVYSAFGALGQSITVYPEIDVVVAFKTHSDTRKSNSLKTVKKVLKLAAEMYEPNKI